MDLAAKKLAFIKEYLHLTNDTVRKKVYELDGKGDPIEEEVEKRVQSRLNELKESIINELMVKFNKPGTIKMDYNDSAP